MIIQIYFRLGGRVWPLNWTSFRHSSAPNRAYTKDYDNVLSQYRDICSNKFEVGASTTCEKANTAGTQENFFRASGRARARCPSTTFRASTRAWARCPNLCAETNERLFLDWRPCTGTTESERNLRSISNVFYIVTYAVPT